MSGFVPGVLEPLCAGASPTLGSLLGQEGSGSTLGARSDREGVGDPGLAGVGEVWVLVTADGPFLRRAVPEPRLERPVPVPVPVPVPHHSRSLSTKAAVLEKVGQARRVQRAQQRAGRHRLGQKALQRQNRTRQRPPRRAGQHSGPFIHQPCQRHHNY